MSEKNSFYETYKKIRKDWEDIKPTTKTIENKKKYIFICSNNSGRPTNYKLLK